MNNCLVTKLKGTVDNDNLLIYGVMKLKVSSNIVESNSYFHFYVEDDSEATMTIESDDENDYFMEYSTKNKIGKTITAVKNQSTTTPATVFSIHGCIGKTLIINDPNYKVKTLNFWGQGFYQSGKSLEEDLKFREMTNINNSSAPELVCNVKKLIKNTNNEPYNVKLTGSENVVYDDIKVLAYTFPVSKTSKDFGLILHSSVNKTIRGKRDILQIIAVRRYLGNTEGDMHFIYPQNAYIGDVPLNTYGSFSQIKFAWTEDTIKVYTAGDDSVYSEVATISNSDKYDWE